MIIEFEATKDADLSLLPPKRASGGAAGYDLCANSVEPILLKKGAIALIPTGLKIALPENIEAQIRPRSGLAVKHGITVVNAPGTIDWDYRGEIKVGLVNLSGQDFTITHGMRIAQMVLARVEIAEFHQGKIGESARGAGGFGSTGLETS